MVEPLLSAGLLINILLWREHILLIVHYDLNYFFGKGNIFRVEVWNNVALQMLQNYKSQHAMRAMVGD